MVYRLRSFPEYARENWEGIKASLLNGTYRPHPVKRVEIPKDSGGTRKLGIPIVMDRVIQQAITQVLTPVFDPHFSESSFGFRPGRSAHQAVRKVLKDICEGYRYAFLSRYIQGWMNYFGVGMRYNDVVELDHWLRRRIRMCYWKQWRRARRRIGELIKLGSARYQAILTGLSRKSYWHLAKTLSTNMGLSNAFLEKQGLVSIRTLWIQIHYPAKAR